MLVFLAVDSFGQKRVPKFSDYSVSVVGVKKNAPIRLTKDTMSFRTRLRWAAKNMKPNFAGRYILTEWGCGAACRSGAVIDALTGKIYSWAFSICCWDVDFHQVEKFEPIDFRLNSKLIVFTGLRNESDRDTDRDFHYYKFEKNKFVYIRTIKKESN